MVAGLSMNGKMINKSNAESIIDNITSLKSISSICFTGGEPFLHQKMLNELIRYAKAKFLFTEAITNCFWADTRENTIMVLKKVKQSGLDVLNISVDKMHQEVIDKENLIRCYELTKIVDIKNVLLFLYDGDDTYDVKRVVSDLGFKNYKKEGNIYIFDENTILIKSNIIPIGKALKYKNNYEKNEIKKGPCNNILRELHIDVMGNVYPCCSALAIHKKFSIGNIYKTDLFEIVERANKNKYIQILIDKGPEGIIVDNDEHMRYTHKCHLCFNRLSEKIARNKNTGLFQAA